MSQLNQLSGAPLVQKSLPKQPKVINIQPREDEGREPLPPYSTSINLSNYFQRKMEFDGPGLRAVDRDWNRVLVTLQGTAFRIYKPAPRSIFGTPSTDQACDSNLIRCYNLQYAQVGVAADYIKKQYVIRIRAETEQFLLSCDKIETLVTWTQTLCAAIDLAPSLDEREYPEDLSIPRRQRYRHASATARRNSSEGGATTNPTSNSHQPSRQSFRRASSSNSTARSSSSHSNSRTRSLFRSTSESWANSSSSSHSNARSSSASRSSFSSQSTNNLQLSSISHDCQPRPTIGPSSVSSAPVAQMLPVTHPDTDQPEPRPRATSFSHFRRDHDNTRTNRPQNFSVERSSIPVPRFNRLLSRVLPNLHSDEHPDTIVDGKWRPLHRHWTALYDIAYAIRCLNVLTSYMPRKSNIVVANEEFWVVDWSTGAMDRLCHDSSRVQDIRYTSKFQQDDVKGLPPSYETLTESSNGVIDSHSQERPRFRSRSLDPSF